MLFLAIVLTIAAAVLFAAGFALIGYVMLAKLRQFRRDSGSDTEAADGLPTW